MLSNRQERKPCAGPRANKVTMSSTDAESAYRKVEVDSSRWRFYSSDSSTGGSCYCSSQAYRISEALFEAPATKHRAPPAIADERRALQRAHRRISSASS